MKKQKIAAIVLTIAALILAQCDSVIAGIIGITALACSAIIIIVPTARKKKPEQKYLTDEVTVKISYTFMDPVSQVALCALDTVITIPPQKVDKPPDSDTYREILNIAGETWLKDNVRPQFHVINVTKSQP